MSHLAIVGLEILWLITAAGAAFALSKLAVVLVRLSAHAHPRLTILLWVAVCILTASLAVFFFRRIGGLMLVGAMLTDYGRAARLRGRPPVWLDAPPENALRLVHLSDLHVGESSQHRLVERNDPAGNQAFDRVLGHSEVAAADLVLITGDITDRGTQASWDAVMQSIDSHDLAQKIILVPGNHDLALLEILQGKDGRQRLWRADRFGIVGLANLYKFVVAFSRTRGGTSGFVDGAEGPVPFEDAFREVERAVKPTLDSLPNRPVPKRSFTNRHAWYAYRDEIEAARDKLLTLFPVAVSLPELDTVVYVLNSCATVCRHPFSNALGHVGYAQYARLNSLGKHFGAAIRLVALHHHVVRRSEELGSRLIARLMAKFTVLGDPRPLVRFCRRQNVRAVLHGHRHLSYQLRLPFGTLLLAAPSSTLGDELAGDPRPQLERYLLRPAPDPVTANAHRTHVHL
jgi:hypothetical protein